MIKYFLIICCIAFVFPFSGCKKNQGFDPMTKSQSDFIGTWRGSISTFKNNKLLVESGDIVIYRSSSDYLNGLIFMQDVLVFQSFQFLNGTLYFRVSCNDPANPSCQNWNLGGYAVFSEEGKIDLRISGNECGPFGSEYVDWSGILAQKQVPPDSIRYFCFGKAGNSWSYNITLKNGDSCHIQKQVASNPSGYFFQGASTQTCGWNGNNITLKWTVDPAIFSIVADSTLSIKQFTFPINAKLGVVYNYVLHEDTTTITLVDTSLMQTTPAGTFSCYKFKYTEPVGTGLKRTTRIAWLWLSNRFGVIRQEVLNPVDSTDIKTQVLSSKNF